MKLKGAKKDENELFFLIYILNSLRMMWHILVPSIFRPFFLYLILDLKDCIWNSLVWVVGSLMLTSLLNMTGR